MEEVESINDLAGSEDDPEDLEVDMDDQNPAEGEI